jgi:hypothetical protein
MSDQMEVSTRELLQRMEQGWNTFQAYLSTLTDDQMTTLTDEVGWTVKDHLAHLAVWEDGMVVLLKGESRPARMGIDAATLASHDYDKMNAIMRLQHKDKSLAQVRQMLTDAHQGLVAVISQLSDADLKRPYRSFDPSSSSNDPVWPTIVGNSFGHYEEHQEWIQALVSPLS